MITITSITDARRLIAAWTERYTEQPTDEALHRAARALVRHIGGYGSRVTDASIETFDLDGALRDA